MVVQRKKNMTRLRAMRVKPYTLHVFRGGKWKDIWSYELLPGDICLLEPEPSRKPENRRVIPCDLLVLHGSGICEESILTGESVPQVKESIGALEDGENLDQYLKHKSNILYGGTELLQVYGTEDAPVYGEDMP